MIRAFGLGSNATNYKNALAEVREWLDKEEGKTSATIKIEGNKTTVTLPDGRVGVSRCNPCDKFDIITGIRVALDDIEKKYKKLTDVERRLLDMAQEFGATTIYVMHYPKSDCGIDFDDDNRNTMLSVTHKEAFNWLENGKFYLIRTLLQERS
jgi:hypothetical protein